MIKLIILADDFTGALDTAIKFSKRGIKTCVVNIDFNLEEINNHVEVLAINLETRHLKSEKAYQRIKDVITLFQKKDIYIYKKTDSVLRGNVGIELQALLDYTQNKFLPFIPAYPKLNRYTIQGIQYLGDVPIHESIVANDPIEPIRNSSVIQIIKETSNVNTYYVNQTMVREVFESYLPKDKTIAVFDSATQDDIKYLAKQIVNKNIKIMAGCAALASELAKLIDFSINKERFKINLSKLIIICGSVNPVTKLQIIDAEQRGFYRISLSGEQILSDSYFARSESIGLVEQINHMIAMKNKVIIDTISQDCRQLNKSGEEIGSLIADNLGILVEKIMHENKECTMMITGGDTLLGVIKKAGIKEVYPLAELTEGVVYSYFYYRERVFSIISKSGGFGNENLFTEISELVENQYYQRMKPC